MRPCTPPLLLLLLMAGMCAALPSPSNVSISSYNLQHTLTFSPGPHSPPGAGFRVQVSNSRRKSWRSVVACWSLRAGQTCNLTKAFKDPFSTYRARVCAVTANQTSEWTESGPFEPMSDTVFGPPGVSVSGCGNCLLLRLSVPAELRRSFRVGGAHSQVHVHVQRTRDQTQFSLLLPLQEENVISYLEPGVEYCVRASFVSFLNRNTLPSEAHCAFTSAPPPKLCLQMLKGLLGAFGLLLVLVLLTCVRWVRVRRQQVLPRPERAPPAVCSGFPLSTSKQHESAP
ncbi:interferon alpha/beta receptor 2 [Oryzias melastigma]|uniref:Interferon alpha/beta receptor 2-like n=1 Tax=Oryzias melastigma TaxID=30732 RepID=A0A3B3DQD4_ORYME|nr:interferon alpha/beta receptor 2 [Oryzias melastigma]